jgi:hypothetical protein
MLITCLTVQRFVDRDMLMRYHCGLGVGHSYTHTPPSNGSNQLPAMVHELVSDESDDENHTSLIFDEESGLQRQEGNSSSPEDTSDESSSDTDWYQMDDECTEEDDGTDEGEADTDMYGTCM